MEKKRQHEIRVFLIVYLLKRKMKKGTGQKQYWYAEES